MDLTININKYNYGIEKSIQQLITACNLVTTINEYTGRKKLVFIKNFLIRVFFIFQNKIG